MRARNVKPSLFKNENLAELPIPCRYLFIGLWCLADREGRLDDRPKRIRAEVFPYEDVDVDGLLSMLATAGFITRYVVDGRKYIEIANFTKHQYPHVKEAPSTKPAPEKHHTSMVPFRLNPESPILNIESPILESGGGQVGKNTQPIGRQLSEAAEIERRLVRYKTDPEADDDDHSALKAVIEHVTSDRVSKQPLPFNRRLKILDSLARFQPGVVFLACHAFIRDGCIKKGRDHRYLAGICEGSATSEYIEIQNERKKHELETPGPKHPARMDTRNPTPIGKLLVPHLRRGESE